MPKKISSTNKKQTPSKVNKSISKIRNNQKLKPNVNKKISSEDHGIFYICNPILDITVDDSKDRLLKKFGLQEYKGRAHFLYEK